MIRWKHQVVTFSLFIGLASAIAVSPTAKAAVDIASALKLFGISYVVDLFSSQLDGFVITVTMNKGLGKGEATKVVPIVSAGTGAYVGAAQVTGPKLQVAKVQAVGQLEGAFFADSLRGKVLVPLDSKNPLQGLRRVDQVGVSAIIDITIESAPAQPTPSQQVPKPTPAPKPTPVPAPPIKRDPVPIPSENQVLGRYPALGYAVFASGDAQLYGNNIEVTGDVRANDDIAIKGNSIYISGDVLAGDKVESSGNWRYGKSNGKGKHDGDDDDDDDDDDDVYWKRVSELKTPIFSWSDLQRRAGRVYGGYFTIKSGTQVQGIIAVDGDLLLDGWLGGGGVVLVKGNVTVTRGGTGASNGLLIWAGGEIRIPESNTNINAVLISEHNIKVSGSNVRVRGGLIGRDVSLSGNNLTVIDDSAAVKYLPY